MQLTNQSFHEGGLTCSFTDYQLAEFIQQKLRRAVEMIGQQKNGKWVLGPEVYIHTNGDLIEPNQVKYMWIGHLYMGPKIASQSTACPVELPLSTEPLRDLLEHLRVTIKHSFFPAVLPLGMAMQYQSLLQQLLFCPVPIAFGRLGTGKTTALRCGLAICGVHPSRFYSKASLGKYNDLCSDSHLPLGIDEPPPTRH